MKMRQQIFNKKLKGYSLTEVLFNMILITLVISCGYLAYNYSFSDLGLFDKANEQFQHYVQLKNAMIIDNEKSQNITVNENEINFRNTEITRYKLFGKKIIRETLQSSDTFNLEFKKLNAYYNEKEIASGLTEKIQLQMETNGKPLNITITKRYDAFTKLRGDGN